MEYYLQKSGFETSDVRVSVLTALVPVPTPFPTADPPRHPAFSPSSKRLLALATQRFVSSIAADSFQYARTRTAAKREGTSSKVAAKVSSLSAVSRRTCTRLT